MSEPDNDLQDQPAIQAVIFDLGGVLLRTVDHKPRQELAARLDVKVFELYNLVFDSETARLATLGKISAREHWQTIGARFNLSEKDLEVAIQQFWEGDRLDYALIDTLRSLRPHYKTALLSNAWDNLHALMRDTWKIADAFDELVISAEVGLAKPDHRIFSLALGRLGVHPHQAIFVDDFSENVDAARWLGLRAIHFSSSTQVLMELGSILNVDHGSAR